MKHKWIFILIISFLAQGFISTSEFRNNSILVSNDSLFNISNYNGFSFVTIQGNMLKDIRNVAISDINDLVRIEDDSLKFKISFGCGCGNTETSLVAKENNNLDNDGNNYRLIKLAFRSNDICKARCIKSLAFDISILKKDREIKYLKFDNLNGNIKIK